jgi:hypothetical protein
MNKGRKKIKKCKDLKINKFDPHSHYFHGNLKKLLRNGTWIDCTISKQATT